MTALIEHLDGHGWARTRGPQLRPYALEPLMAAVAVGPATLASWTEVTEPTIRRLAEVGLTETQALVFADVCGVRPETVWPHLVAS